MLLTDLYIVKLNFETITRNGVELFDMRTEFHFDHARTLFAPRQERMIISYCPVLFFSNFSLFTEHLTAWRNRPGDPRGLFLSNLSTRG